MKLTINARDIYVTYHDHGHSWSLIMNLLLFG